MEHIRFGLALRALRRRRRWSQDRLASESSVSRSVIGRVERGRADRVSVATLVRIAAALGARVDVRILWQGEGLDRLLDQSHADIIERLVRTLSDDGWLRATEVSFNIDGQRGSIDILAFHPSTGALLVIEVKSVVPDLQAMLHGIDRKGRIARQVARERGWEVTSVSRLLVLPDDRTARRRVDTHAATFDAALPARTAEVKRWLRDPHEPIAGILFLPTVPQAGTRHRVPRAERVAERGRSRQS